jgi:hypothetical protein
MVQVWARFSSPVQNFSSIRYTQSAFEEGGKSFDALVLDGQALFGPSRSIAARAVGRPFEEIDVHSPPGHGRVPSVVNQEFRPIIRTFYD